MIEINIKNKEDSILPMVQSFLETNPCKKIIIYTCLLYTSSQRCEGIDPGRSI